MSALPTAASLAKPTVRILGCLREFLHLTRRSSAVRLLAGTTSGLRSLKVGPSLAVDGCAALGGKPALLGLAAALKRAALHRTLLLYFLSHDGPPKVGEGGLCPPPMTIEIRRRRKRDPR